MIAERMLYTALKISVLKNTFAGGMFCRKWVPPKASELRFQGPKVQIWPVGPARMFRTPFLRTRFWRNRSTAGFVPIFVGISSRLWSFAYFLNAFDALPPFKTMVYHQAVNLE